jgi:hypothetical protein
VLCRRAHNEDRWADIAPAARVVEMLSELAKLGSSLPSVVSWACAGGCGVSALRVNGR